jgi:hypothetical protein
MLTFGELILGIILDAPRDVFLTYNPLFDLPDNLLTKDLKKRIIASINKKISSDSPLPQRRPSKEQGLMGITAPSKRRSGKLELFNSLSKKENAAGQLEKRDKRYQYLKYRDSGKNDELKCGMLEMLSMPELHINEFRSICKMMAVGDRKHECDRVIERVIYGDICFCLVHMFSTPLLYSKRKMNMQIDKLNEDTHWIISGMEDFIKESGGHDYKKLFIESYSDDLYRKFAEYRAVIEMSEVLSYFEAIVFNKVTNRMYLRKRFYDLPDFPQGLTTASKMNFRMALLETIKKWPNYSWIKYEPEDMAKWFFNSLLIGKFKDTYQALPVLSKDNIGKHWFGNCPRSPEDCSTLENQKGSGKKCKNIDFCYKLKEEKFYTRLKKRLEIAQKRD